MIDLEKYRNVVEARLQELGERLRKVEAALDEPADPDLADQAIELEDEEVLESVGRAGQREAQLLRDALGRIENETYGTCAKCGEEINEARLNAVPFAVLCRNCANPDAA